MKKAFIFIVKGITGGTATLAFRLGCALQEKNYDIFYIKELSNNNENEEMMKKKNFNVITLPQKKWKQQIIEITNSYESVTLFTYIFSYLYILEQIKYLMMKKKIVVNTFLYAALPDAMIIGTNKKMKNKFMFNILNKLNKKYVYELHNNRQILYQDEFTIENHKNFFGFSIKNTSDFIFRIPYDLNFYRSYNKKEKKIISTMARIDFPFKGYIIGLVDIYTKIKKDIDVELWIIGNGRSFSILEKKLASLNTKERAGIKLFGNLNYDIAKNKIAQSTVFVGMGTGVLDAASVYVPSIAVQIDTYKCLGKGFLYRYPNFVGFLDDKDLIDVTDKIYNILNLKEQEYQEICKQSQKIIEDFYSVDTFINKLIRLENSKKLISKSALFKHKFCIFLLNIYHSIYKINWQNFNNN